MAVQRGAEGGAGRTFYSHNERPPLSEFRSGTHNKNVSLVVTSLMHTHKERAKAHSGGAGLGSIGFLFSLAESRPQGISFMMFNSKVTSPPRGERPDRPAVLSGMIQDPVLVAQMAMI